MDSCRALETARSIGHHLAESAIWFGGRCTWLGSTQSGDRNGRVRDTCETLGPTLYGGTTGVSIFLAELHARTGEEKLARTAAGAIAHALDHVDRLPEHHTYGLFVGRLGVARGAAVVGSVLDKGDIISSAAGLVEEIMRADLGEAGFDLITGLAGAIPALLDLGAILEDPELDRRAVDLGVRLVEMAEPADEGWAWTAGGIECARALTGFSHGAGAVGWSLLELYRHAETDEFLAAAEEAFRYENAWFDPVAGNWPDFRERDGVERPASFMTTWCHGAPGIGLSRIPALELSDGGTARGDIESAIRCTGTALERRPADADFSLCHGVAGLSECLRRGAVALGDPVPEIVTRRAELGADRFGHTPDAWPCGVRSGSNPSLMLGLAGIGYSYLSIACPDLPSILTIEGPRGRER